MRGVHHTHQMLILVALSLFLCHTSLATFNYPYNYYHCEDPGIPNAGYRQGDEFFVGASLTFSCNSGFALYGSRNITCEHGAYEAYWSDDAPICIPVSEGTGRTPHSRCGKTPGAGPHAIALPSSNKTVVQYECHGDKNEHVEVSGDKVVYCYNKKWYGEPLECRRKASCETQIPNEHITHQMSGTLEGDIVLFTCEKGFVLLGSSHATCLNTGEWSSNWPSCAPVSCPYPSGVPNGQVRLITATEAEYRCHSGYDLVGASQVWCMGDGAWGPSAPPSCEPVDCGSLGDPVNGRVLYSDTTYNHRAYYDCNTGHNLIGSFSRRCRSDGQWFGDEPICQPKLCPNPTVPSNGIASVSVQSVGGVVTYSCIDGYILSGTSTRTCLTTAQWSGSPPSCLGVDCGNLPDPVGGTVVMKSSRFNSVATYNCDRNKKLVGVVTRTCQADGTWSEEEPRCILVVDCNEPEPIDHGKVTYTMTTPTSLANYSCNNGYTLVGNSASVECNEKGKWEGPLPACAAIDCGHPPTIHNGQATFSSTNFTSVATYTCDKGYSLSGDKTILCQANGQWKEPVVICEEVNCGEPPIIPKGVPLYNSSLFLSKVSYSCLPGYTLMGGSHSLVCQANNQWFGDVPSCLAIDCCKPESIDNGAVIYSSTTVTSRATYNCDSGYALVGDRSFVVCNDTGNWEGPVPTCVVNCGLLDSPNNQTIIHYPENSTLVNATAQYSCLLGYILSTKSTRVCSENGTWTESEPVCQPVNCGTLPSPDNGIVRHSLSTTLASPARYSCNIGFRRIGMEIRFCLVNGTWSGTAPTCEIIDCGSLDNPENGRVEINSTIFTSRAVYSCDQGYMITSGAPSERICRIDGTWGGEEPTCELIDCGGLTVPNNGKVQISSTLHGGIASYTCNIGYMLDEPSPRTCGDNGVWSGRKPTCELVNCGDPGTLVNGQRTFFGTTYRQIATFNCNNGFTMIGDGARRCEAEGEWTGEIPQCIANVPHCGIPESVDNGYYILQATIPGSQVLYGCIDGFELVGSDTRTCGTNEKWSGGVPECRRLTRCSYLETPAFSRRVGKSREIGDVVYFICDDDYDTVGSNARVCQDNRKWSGTQPACVLRNSSCSGESTTKDSTGRLCECVDGKLINCCRHRQDWLSLSIEEKVQYIQAVLTTSSHQLYKPFYESLMQLYRDGSGTVALSFTPPETQFLPWHRYFLQQYEDLLRLIDPTLTLPYWDWTLYSHHPFMNPIFSPQIGFGNSTDFNSCVQDGPFRKNAFFLSSSSGGGCLVRHYLADSVLLTRDQLNDLILVQPANQFGQFFSLLTIPYVSIRCAVGGTMCSTTTVPTDDPLHILILSYFDSLWDRWQNKSSSHKLAGYGKDTSPLFLTDNLTPSDYHDNSYLPYGASVCYGEPVDSVSSSGSNRRRAIEEMACISDSTLGKLSLSDQDKHTIKAACRLLYSYLNH